MCFNVVALWLSRLILKHFNYYYEVLQIYYKGKILLSKLQVFQKIIGFSLNLWTWYHYQNNINFFSQHAPSIVLQRTMTTQTKGRDSHDNEGFCCFVFDGLLKEERINEATRLVDKIKADGFFNCTQLSLLLHSNTTIFLSFSRIEQMMAFCKSQRFHLPSVYA